MGLFKNFLLEQNGAQTERPSIKNNTFYCHSYQENLCKSCEPTIVPCESTDDYEPACFAVWRNFGEQKEIVHKGCWTYPKLMKNCLSTDRCMAAKAHDKPDIFGKDVFFCCCETSLCNEHLAYDPSLLTKSPVVQSSGFLDINNNTKTVSPLMGNEKNVNQTAIVHSLNNILFISVPIFVLALLFLIIYFVYRRFRMKFLDDSVETAAPGHHQEGMNGYKNGGPLLLFKRKPPQIVKMSKIHMNSNNKGYKNQPNGSSTTALMAREPVKLGDLISRGRYGSVYVANYESELIAVKVFSVHHGDSYTVERDIYKINVLRQCENVLKFLHVGDQLQSNEEFWLTTEYHPNGSVYDYLKVHTLTFIELLHVSKTMLNGLAFLHEEILGSDENNSKPTIIHRDFKSKNVLLKKDLTAVVADFGLALKCYHGRTPDEKHIQVGTSRYMAPELLFSSTEFSAFAFKQIDVYAASLVLWELLSRCTMDKTPIGEYKLPYEEELGLNPSQFELKDFVAKGQKRPVFKDNWHSHDMCKIFCHMISEMWDQDPEARLTVHSAFERVQSLHKLIISCLTESPISATSCSTNDDTQPLICQNRTLMALSTSNNE